jgi:hypothetical protein
LSSGEDHNVKYRDVVVKGEMASFDISTQARKTKEKQKKFKREYLGIIILHLFLISLTKLHVLEPQMFLDISPSDPTQSLLQIQ